MSEQASVEMRVDMAGGGGIPHTYPTHPDGRQTRIRTRSRNSKIPVGPRSVSCEDCLNEEWRTAA